MQTPLFEMALRVLAPFTIAALLSGCLFLNDVNPVSMPKTINGDRAAPPADRALVIFGLSVEGPGYHPYTQLFSIQVDEYSAERQNITGNCWRYNYMKANVPGIMGSHQYFAFDVKPGYYVYPGFLGALHKNLAFEVPAGRMVYLGDFIWTSDATIELKRDPSAITSYFGEDVVLADTRLVPQVITTVLCTP